ncbi:SpoIIE family protein phosphatase [Streptomyces oceani]|uniref:SpoIIE family protein phosphatase n=1 Tax=Streptomyces oceani TaxID=1075402 RepID=UPI000872936F
MEARGSTSGRAPDAEPAPETAPAGWPIDTETALALNRTGSFDWDIERGVLHLDAPALAVWDLSRAEYDDDPRSLSRRLPAPESSRLDTLIAQALESGKPDYGAYFQIQRRDGTVRWAHTQGTVWRDERGRASRVIGIMRDATDELSQPTERLALNAEGLRHTSVVERTTAALAHARTVREVLEALESSRGMEQVGAVSVLVGLVENGRVRLLGGGPAEHPPQLPYNRLDDPLPMSETVRTRTPRFVVSREDFAFRYPRVLPYVESVGASAGAYLPLIAQGTSIGSLGLLYQSQRDFSPEERDLLTALASSVAQSVQRARLYEQEHELAKGLQEAMLPHTVPDIPGVRAAVRYRPAHQGRDIGGDWYDVIPLPGGRVAAVVGDVQGHDTQAAAVMGQLRIVLRAYAAEGHSAASVLSRASAFLNDMDTGRFATCLYVEADPVSGWLRVVRAGHLTPILRRPDGSCRQFPVLGALPLGLSAHFELTEHPVTTVELEPGETLVLFTDGLVEVPGGNLEDGLGALAERIRTGPGDVERLADALCEVPEGFPGTDDMALVLLQREATAATQPGRRLHQHVAAGDPEGLSAVRDMVRAAARSWRAGERVEEMVLVTDELTTNALLHTGGGAVVTVYPLSQERGRVRVEVTDRSSTHPQLRTPSDTSLAGRGLLLVDQLADMWGVESRGTGKCVWCEFANPQEGTSGDGRTTRDTGDSEDGGKPSRDPAPD